MRVASYLRYAIVFKCVIVPHDKLSARVVPSAALQIIATFAFGGERTRNSVRFRLENKFANIPTYRGGTAGPFLLPYASAQNRTGILLADNSSVPACLSC